MSSRQRKIIRKDSTGRRIVEQGRVRILCVAVFFLLCFVSIAVRMVEISVIRNPSALKFIVSDMENETTEEVTMAAEGALARGDIVDRNGVLLSTSLMTASVFAKSMEMKNIPEVVDKLSAVLKLSKKQLERSLRSGKSFVWIKRNLTPAEQQQVNSLGIPGLYFLPEERRVYPHGNMFAHALGYVDIDNKGLAGLERHFDRRLRDKMLNHDPLEISLDVRLQAILHDEIEKAMKEFKAIGAAGMIMDVHTGELLSLVSLPDFDPHKPASAKETARFNRATLGVYEMGSTFKTFTAAMALDEGKVSMKGGYDASRPFKIASFTISDTHPKNRWLTVPEIYAYSSNIGTAKMALDIGPKKQKEFMKKLGMLDSISLEIPETASPLYPDDWKEISTVTISYGHGISVTPLHLLRGIAAMVNGGTLPDATLVKRDAAVEGKQVISEDTSHNVRRLMRLVVDYGTGSNADVPGYRVGGKTGTAEKITASGGYNADAKLASFVSVFPVDDPKYAILVMVDEPKGNASTYGYATGGWVSAPVVGQVIARMGPLLGMPPRFDVPEDDAERYWTDKSKSRKNKQAIQPALAKRYVHQTSY